MNGGTNIALSLKQAGQLLREEEPGAARVIVLLTDGRVDPFQGGWGASAPARQLPAPACHTLHACSKPCMQCMLPAFHDESIVPAHPGLCSALIPSLFSLPGIDRPGGGEGGGAAGG
jgi:hypothetical protein